MDDVVFIPGLLSTAAAFDGLRGRLGGRLDVMMPSACADFEAIVEDMADLLPDGVVLGGHSMGGYIALGVALRAPDKVRALILLSTVARNDSPDAAAQRGKVARWAQANGVEALVAAQMKTLPAAANREDTLLAERLSEMARAIGLQTFADHQHALSQRPDRTAALASISCPSLVLAGSEDTVTPPEQGRDMADMMADAQFHIIEGTGHLLPMEAPEACADHIGAFLAVLDRRGQAA